MFTGNFRAKLNSRSRRRASVFATAVVALHSSFLSLYPLLTYAYRAKYFIRLLKNEEWTFLACVSLGTGHALNFLATRWSTAACAFIICGGMGSARDADCIRIVIVEHRGKGEIVSLHKKDVGDASLLLSWQIDWLFSSPLIRSHSLSRTNKIHTYFCQTNP